MLMKCKPEKLLYNEFREKIIDKAFAAQKQY